MNNPSETELVPARAGLKAHYIFEMEHDKRPIGKDMAKRLAEALNAFYKKLLYSPIVPGPRLTPEKPRPWRSVLDQFREKSSGHK